MSNMDSLNKLMIDTQNQQRNQADIIKRLCYLMMCRDILWLDILPNWKNCFNVSIDIKGENLWPNYTHEFLPMLNVLAMKLIIDDKKPQEICLVKANGQISIVVRTDS